MQIPIEGRLTHRRRAAAFLRKRWRWIAALLVLLLLRVGWYSLSGLTLPEVLICRSVALSLVPDHGGLPLYELSVSETDLAKLVPPQHDLDRSYATVKVRVRDGEDQSEWGDGRLRLRGSIQPEAGPKRSFRLVLPDGRAVNLLSADIKDSHVVPFELWVAERVGARAPRCRFVRLWFNNVDWGLYVEVEQWGRRMLERWGLPDADLYGESLEPGLVSQFDKDASGYRKYDPQPGREKDFAALHALYRLVEHADDATFEREIFAVLDRDSALAWTVHMALLNSYHQYWGVGYRLLANPVSGKLEIIPWDAIPALVPRIVPGQSSPQLMPSTNVLVNRLLNHPDFLRLYSARLVELIGALEGEIDEYLAETYLHPDVLGAARRDEAQGYYPTVVHAPHEQLSLALTGERWPLLIGLMRQMFREVWDRLFAIHQQARLGIASPSSPDAQQRLTFRLSYESQVAAALREIRLALAGEIADGTVNAQVHLTAIASSPRIRFRGQRHDAQRRVRSWSGEGQVRAGYLTFRGLDLTLAPRFPEVQLTGVNMDRVDQHAAYICRRRYLLDIEFERPLRFDGAAHRLSAVNLAVKAEVRTRLTTYDPTGATARRLQHASGVAGDRVWLRWDGDARALVVTAATVELTRTLIVPEGTRLVIPAGTTFRVAPGASLLCFGPLDARGTASKPIRFLPAADGGRWGAIGVVGARAAGSTLAHVHVRGASASRVAEVALAAAINFHLAAPSRVEACRCEAPGLTTIVSVTRRDDGVFERNELR